MSEQSKHFGFIDQGEIEDAKREAMQPDPLFQSIPLDDPELRGLVEAVEWACGEGGSDFLSEAERKERGLPIYWWRQKLRTALAAYQGEGSKVE